MQYFNKNILFYILILLLIFISLIFISASMENFYGPPLVLVQPDYNAIINKDYYNLKSKEFIINKDKDYNNLKSKEFIINNQIESIQNQANIAESQQYNQIQSIQNQANIAESPYNNQIQSIQNQANIAESQQYNQIQSIQNQANIAESPYNNQIQSIQNQASPYNNKIQSIQYLETHCNGMPNDVIYNIYNSLRCNNNQIITPDGKIVYPFASAINGCINYQNKYAFDFNKNKNAYTIECDNKYYKPIICDGVPYTVINNFSFVCDDYNNKIKNIFGNYVNVDDKVRQGCTDYQNKYSTDFNSTTILCDSKFYKPVQTTITK